MSKTSCPNSARSIPPFSTGSSIRSSERRAETSSSGRATASITALSAWAGRYMASRPIPSSSSPPSASPRPPGSPSTSSSATSPSLGSSPRYLTIDLNLPPEMREAALEEMWGTVHAEAENTGYRLTATRPAIPDGSYPSGRRGDLDRRRSEARSRGRRACGRGTGLITKGPAIETTGLLPAFSGKFSRRRAAFQKEAAAVFSPNVGDGDCACQDVPGRPRHARTPRNATSGAGSTRWPGPEVAARDARRRPSPSNG